MLTFAKAKLVACGTVAVDLLSETANVAESLTDDINHRGPDGRQEVSAARDCLPCSSAAFF